MTVPGVPWWGVASSAAAPVLLVGGWTLAAGLQPPSFDPVTDTVSGLMAAGATDRWVMTTAFLAVGACYIVTGVALRPARLAGRLILVTGAAAGMLVAANPEPAGGGSVSHAVWAALGFAGLAAWPAVAWRRGTLVPWGLRPGFCFGAVAGQLILLAWFVAEILIGARQIGLAERIVGVSQALCPLAAALSCRLAAPLLPLKIAICVPRVVSRRMSRSGSLIRRSKPVRRPSRPGSRHCATRPAGCTSPAGCWR
jgi:hypothetical protein